MTGPSKRQPASRSAPPGVTEVMRRKGLPVNRAPDDSADTARLLRIYLGDHFAGSTSGLSLARRIARNNRGKAYGPALSAFADEVGEDRETLRRVMHDLGFSPPPAKSALARAAEMAGRLKPNGRLIGRSPLSSVIEFEAMRMGVEGKASVWRSLRALADDDDRLSAAELDRLVQRAEEQARRLEEMRVGIVASTFNPRGAEPGGAEASRWESDPARERSRDRR